MNQTNETRILHTSSLTSSHAIVSMPKTAWYWLDDLVERHFPRGGYSALVRAFGGTADGPDALSRSLRRKAREACEAQMADLYNLSNDNIPEGGYAELKTPQGHPDSPDLTRRLPSVTRLFHFMPHATYLTTVWERRNFRRRRSR